MQLRFKTTLDKATLFNLVALWFVSRSRYMLKKKVNLIKYKGLFRLQPLKPCPDNEIFRFCSLFTTTLVQYFFG